MECGVWSSECGVWSVECVDCGVCISEFGVWSLEFGVWSVEFGVWSLECGVWSLECGVWSFGVWIWDFGAWGLELGVWSVDCGLWSFGMWSLGVWSLELGVVELWSVEFLELWSFGVVELWSCGLVELWRCAVVELVELWSLGALELWSCGVLEFWSFGLPLFGRLQLAVDTTLVCALRSDGTRHSGAAEADGVVLSRERRRKEQRYPELVGPGSRARLVVLAVEEVGGRWSAETRTFVAQLAKAKVQQEPHLLQKRAEQAWRMQWGATSLVLQRRQSPLASWTWGALIGADGHTPLAWEVEADHRHGGLAG